MGKTYEDLSRRALIKLNKDFDQENDAKLLEYLTENGEKYESIRPIEVVVDRLDQVVDTVSNSGIKVKDTLVRETTRVLDSFIDNMSKTISDLEVSK